MILGIDVGARTFGWAVVTPRTGRVEELGELFQPEVGGSAGGANTARVHVQAPLLNELVTRYRVTTIGGEARSLGGHPAARLSMAAAQSCCWGMLAALAALRDLVLMEVAPTVWQRAIIGRPGKVDYAEVESALAEYVTGRARAQLAEIPTGRRNHALDGAGVGILAAVRPAALTIVAQPRRGRAT